MKTPAACQLVTLLFLMVSLRALGEIQFTELPRPVQKAAMQRAKSAAIETIRVEREAQRILYHIGFQENQTWVELEISQTGSIMRETTRHVTGAREGQRPAAAPVQVILFSDLPRDVQETLWKKTELTALQTIERSTLEFYDLLILKEGRRERVRLTMDGAILKRDDREKARFERPLDNPAFVPFEELPEPAREMIAKQAEPDQLDELQKGELPEGGTVYEAAFEVEDRQMRIRLSQEGGLAGVREARRKRPGAGVEKIEARRLPPIVQAVVQQRIRPKQIQDIERRTVNTFQITVAVEGGTEMLQVMENGALVELAPEE